MQAWNSPPVLRSKNRYSDLRTIKNKLEDPLPPPFRLSGGDAQLERTSTRGKRTVVQTGGEGWLDASLSASCSLALHQLECILFLLVQPGKQNTPRVDCICDVPCCQSQPFFHIDHTSTLWQYGSRSTWLR